MNANATATSASRLPWRLAFAAGGLFLLWRMGKGMLGFAWAVFGVALALYWSGAWGGF